MIVKKTKQLGNFKKGINLYVPRRKSSSAPSGIPVATTSQIIVTSTNSWILSSPFDKLNPAVFQSLADEEVSLEYLGGNGWNFFAGGDTRAYALGSADSIPTSGYTIVSGGGSITITAA